jgi:hypothetical protein
MLREKLSALLPQRFGRDAPLSCSAADCHYFLVLAFADMRLTLQRLESR